MALSPFFINIIKKVSVCVMKFENYLIESEISELESKLKDSKQYLKAPNGKDTNLTKRQWLTVRTKAFKNWFGDWENEPKKSSKVLDDNGEPLVAYHGTASEFTKFDVTKSGGHGFDFGKLIFFTDNPSVASGYSIRLAKSEEFNHEKSKMDVEWEKFRLTLVKNNFDVNHEDVVKARAEWDAQDAKKKKVFDDIFDFKIVTEGAIVMNGFINIRNPLIVDGKGKGWRDVHGDAFELFHSKGNYDGVIIKRVIDSASTNTQIPCDIFAFPKSNQVKSAIASKFTNSDHIHENVTKNKVESKRDV